jgi:two-component system, NtrC family, response regulator GlrR
MASSTDDAQSTSAEPQSFEDTIRVLPASGARVAATVRRFRLVNEGDESTFECVSGRCQVGSHPGNELQLFDPATSRFHAEVSLEGPRALVKDLGSTSGTFIDDVRVTEGSLKHGSVLGVGNVRLRFETDETVTAVPANQQSRFGALTGNSLAMRQAFMLLEKASRSDATVLIEGETGTGKSVAARGLHQRGGRRDAPFLVLDCGALPPALLEVELFGSRDGALEQPGVFDEARGGTVVLDEVGELPQGLQATVLKVLERGQAKGDVRLIATTHRDLRPSVNAGAFRSDLYFQLSVVRVMLPPLRHRADDVPALARALLDELGATPKTCPALFTPEFLSTLQAATWPGNGRQLRNHLERCVGFEASAGRGRGDVTTTPGGGADFTRGSLAQANRRVLERFEKDYLTALMARHHGQVAEAALEAEVDRVWLARLIRKHGLTRG